MAFSFVILGGFSRAQALELPVAANSPLTGVTFDDMPMSLPVEQNFQMAMLAVSSELGRSCGNMEAYGWRMNQTEQVRVDKIFNNAVEKLRSMAYIIAPESVKSAAKDITIFTADKTNKHFLFMWSANDLGLVLNICETGIPVPPTHRPRLGPSMTQVYSAPVADKIPAVAEPEKAIPDQKEKNAKALSGGKAAAGEGFSPTGTWVGYYICSQGHTGATLEIDRLNGRDFTGAFKFYSTEKNPGVPEGYYAVFGQYDKETKRVLINPGKWIKRPQDYYNTVIVGSFDPARNSFSGFFQGISGCTSIEAVRVDTKPPAPALTKKKASSDQIVKKKKKKAKKTKSSVKKAPLVNLQENATSVEEKKDAGIDLTPQPAASPAASPEAAPTATSTAPVGTAPAVPATTPAVPAGTAPAATPAVPAGTTPAATPAAPVGTTPATAPAAVSGAAFMPRPDVPSSAAPAAVPPASSTEQTLQATTPAATVGTTLPASAK
ncbi:MAG: hypothetical protein WC464_01135 [Bdellovibrionales bacterium]